MLLTLSLVLLLVHFVTKKGGGKSVPRIAKHLVLRSLRIEASFD